MASRPISPWLSTLLFNGLVVVAILALIPVSRFVESENHFDPYYARIVMLVGINIVLAVSLQLINGISGQFSLGHAGFMAVGAYLSGYATNRFSDNFEKPGG